DFPRNTPPSVVAVGVLGGFDVLASHQSQQGDGPAEDSDGHDGRSPRRESSAGSTSWPATRASRATASASCPPAAVIAETSSASSRASASLTSALTSSC